MNRSSELGRLTSAALALALSVALAACGGGDEEGQDQAATSPSQAETEAPTTGGSDDACGFLTADEVAAAGIEGAQAQPVDDPTGAKSCNYTGDDAFEGLSVIVKPGGGQSWFDQYEELLTDAEPLPGFGDEAVLSASNPQQVTVLVIQDDTVLTLGGSITPEAAQSLARTALDRVGG